MDDLRDLGSELNYGPPKVVIRMLQSVQWQYISLYYVAKQTDNL